MAYSYSIVVADGVGVVFPVTFPYLEQEHIHVAIDGVETVAFNWVSGTIIQLIDAPANGAAVKIYRLTPITTLSTVYSTPAVLDHRDWNKVLKQLQYVCQEAFDLGEISGEFVADVTTFVNTTLAAAADSAAAALASENAAEAAQAQVAIDAAAVAAGLLAIVSHMVGSNNLSELTNAGTARTNLGLGDAATKNVGTGAGSVAAGDRAEFTTVATLSTDALRKNATAAITVGYTVTPNAVGNMGTGNFTPNPALGNYQTVTNNGAVTFQVPANDCAIDILLTNSASAGAVSFSGYTVSADVGDAYVTTSTYKFLLSIRRIGGVSTYIWKALQ
jgi:hypothetical protein